MKKNCLIERIHARKIISAWINEDEVFKLYTIVPLKRTVEYNHEMPSLHCHHIQILNAAAQKLNEHKHE